MRPKETFVGQPVRSLQTMLRVLAEDDIHLPTIVPDGIYGNQTRQAVFAFQQKHQLPPTGVSDSETWDKIVEEHGKAQIRLSPAEPLQLILNPNQVIEKDEYHPYLFLVQNMLGTLGEVYSVIPSPSPTGVLDETTADSLLTFQRISNLPATGELDKITWKHLALQYPLAVNIQQSKTRTIY